MTPQDTKTIYMMGIGGIAMGTLATMLMELGYKVVGSDQNLYPPMSTHLESLGIPVCQGYKAENIVNFSPDVVVIGNVIRRENPEAQKVLEEGIPYLSMPEAIERFFLSRHKSMVVAGTHGKSTTSSLLAWVLTHAGEDPSAFIGAFLKSWQRSYRLGNGKYMVLEGDEYDTAFFDKGAKFLHYRPHIAVLTSVEYDHADIFPNFESVVDTFRKYIHLVPEDGYLIACADDPTCVALSRECRGRVYTYGWSERADWQFRGVRYSPGEVSATWTNPLTRLQESIRSKLPGRHNLSNTLAVIAAASLAGLPLEKIQDALLEFQGVKRRQDILGEARGILVMDDFAHHPTAVKETIQALRLFYPDRRLVAAFEPRTNSSRRRVFQESYAVSFDDADLVCIKQPPGMDAIAESERLDCARLVHDIRKRGKEAEHFENSDMLLQFLMENTRSGDLVLCMSNGSFDGVPQRLISELKSLHMDY